MKIPLPNFFLKNLKNEPLPEITPDDVDATLERAELESLRQRKDAILEKFEQETSKNISNEGFKTPMLFKGHKCNKSRSSTPIQLPKSANPSFSQLTLSTPVTPSTSWQRFNVVTPSLSQRSFSADGFIIPTPMVLRALDSLQSSSADNEPQVPDILDFIDDDTRDLSAIENHILRNSEMELTDNNIVDYLLETTDDLIDIEEKPLQKPKSPVVSEWNCLDEGQPLRRKTRRRYHHTKIITAEMEKSLRQVQKEKAKERRKERIERFRKKESKGTRKSSRRKPQVKYF